jgi:hypothetical protein
MFLNCNIVREIASYAHKNRISKPLKKMITMKAIYLLTAMLGLQFNMIYAGDFSSGKTISEIVYSVRELSALAPLNPKEADFSDVAPESENNFKSLAPVTPKEASFEEENGQVSETPVYNLAPELPSEADFNDSIEALNLAPSTPAEADFEEEV